MQFLELDLDQRIPDAKNIWMFRKTLAQAHLVETLFEQFETYSRRTPLAAPWQPID